MQKSNNISKRGRPFDKNKSTEILKVAARLFMKHGFYSTSMDHIAREAGISKLTLYNRFKDKNVLFSGVIANKAQQYVPDEIFEAFSTKTAYEAIYGLAKSYFSLILSNDSIAMYRMMIAESVHEGDLTRLFYENGPKRLKAMIAEKLAYLNSKSSLVIPDPYKATSLLVSFFKGSDIYNNKLLNIGKESSPEEIESYLKQAVDSFISIYRVK